MVGNPLHITTPKNAVKADLIECLAGIVALFTHKRFEHALSPAPGHRLDALAGLLFVNFGYGIDGIHDIAALDTRGAADESEFIGFFDTASGLLFFLVVAGGGDDEIGSIAGNAHSCAIKADVTAAILLSDPKTVNASVIFDGGDTATTADSRPTGVKVVQVLGDLPKKRLLLKFCLHQLDGGTAGGRAFQALNGGKGEHTAEDDDTNQDLTQFRSCVLDNPW